MEPDPSPPQPPYTDALTQRMKDDTCYRCKNKGHWAKDCPAGSPSKPMTPADVPVLHCSCGAACSVIVSNQASPMEPDPSPPQTPSTDALTQRMKDDTCYRCKNKGHWAKDCPSKPMTPADVPVLHCSCGAACSVIVSNQASPMEPDPSPPQPPYTDALTQRMNDDTCYRCKNKGHWAKDCPAGSPSKPKTPADIPVLHCSCGAACSVIVSNTERNPNRKFYSCPGNSNPPGEKGCGFVIWCDKITARQCDCGVGTCRIYAEKNGAIGKNYYYGCRIRKGFGSCGFRQWVDEQRPIMALPPAETMEAEPPAMVDPDNSSELADMIEDQEICGGKELDDIMLSLSGRVHNNGGDLQDVVVEDGSGTTSPDSGVEDSTMDDELAPADQQIEMVASRTVSEESEIHRRQKDFMKQIFAAGDGLTHDRFNLMPGLLQFMSLCGRIAFQPSRWIAEPAEKPFFGRKSPPTDPTQPPYSDALTQRMNDDTCYRCKNKGHWAKDCPAGSPSKPKTPADIPVLHCSCGAACSVIVSNTERNPNRKFYSCPGNSNPPGEKGCGFVIWCDKITARQCDCGVGTCRIYAEKNGAIGKNYYYGCRIRKGFGSCGFRQRVDEQRPIMALPPAETMEAEPPAMVDPDNSSELADMIEDQEICGGKELDDIMLSLSGRVHNNGGDLQDVVVEDGSGTTSPDSGVEDSTMDDELAPADQQIEMVASRTVSEESEIHRRQKDFMKQIFAAGDGLTLDRFNLMPGLLQFMSLCGRIAFQPSRWIAEPAEKPFFGRILPSLSAMTESNNVEVPVNRARGLFPNGPSGPGPNDGLPGNFSPFEPSCPNTNDEQLMQLLAWVAELLSNGNTNQLSKNRTEGNYAGLLQRTAEDVQKEFITQLDCIGPNLELLKNEAMKCFATLCRLHTPDCGEFIRQVLHYIECASSLVDMDRSLGPGPSLQEQELRHQHSVAQKNCDDISQLHKEKLNAYNASQSRLQELRKKRSEIEAEIAKREAESSELEGCLVEVNQKVKRSRKNLEAVAEEVKEAQDKAMKRAAAKDAVEKSRSKLRQGISGQGNEASCS